MGDVDAKDGLVDAKDCPEDAKDCPVDAKDGPNRVSEGKSDKNQATHENDLSVVRIQPVKRKQTTPTKEDIADGPEDDIAPMPETQAKNGQAITDSVDGQANPVADTQEFGVKGYLSMFFPTVALVGYILDIASDIVLAVDYRLKGEVVFFHLTMLFIFVPALILMAADLTFLYVDYKASKVKSQNNPNKGAEEMSMMNESGNNEGNREPDHDTRVDPPDAYGPIKIVGRIILAILSLGFVVRIIQHMYYKKKKRTDPTNRIYYKEQAMLAKRDYTILGFIHAFTETYSQAALQLYIFTADPVSIVSLKGFSIVTSILFMPLAYADHYRSLRVQSEGGMDKKNDMPLLVYFFYYLGVLGAMLFRIVSIALFMAAVPPFTVGVPVVNLHFVCVFLWLWFYHQPTFDGLVVSRNRVLSCLGKFFYVILYSVTSMLFYVDLYNEKKKDRVCFPSKKEAGRDIEGGVRGEELRSTKWRMLGYNIILYAESAVFISLGFVWANVDIQMYAMVLLSGMLMHVVFIANYYKFLHPTIGICYKCYDSNNTGNNSQDAQQPLAAGERDGAAKA